jgi:hypothetical protein
MVRPITYNFNDEALVYGTSYWIKLVENTLEAEAVQACELG